ncbi:MAG: S9 family peptidase [Gammaproteobacteria bacterium]|nr:MAG: S9 family peptidase [Gammaproteobacteria bacterium]
MTNKIISYGQWPSSITAEMLTQQSAKLSEPQVFGKDIFWLESRPSEKGRNALVRLRKNGERSDLLSEPHSVRTRAHEYGGASYLVTHKKIFYVLDVDQRVYYIDQATLEQVALSPAGNYRYADFCWDTKRSLLICIREDHSLVNHQKALKERSEIISIDLQGNVQVLVSGADFYSNPRLNPDGDKLSYLCWNHPQMPWDGTECYCADLSSNGEVIATHLIAGGKNESIFQPQWSPSGELFFVSDRNNWWNIYRYTKHGVENICNLAAEFAMPQWVFGMSTYGFLNASQIFCCRSQRGQWHLGLIDVDQKGLIDVPSELKDISGIHCNNGNAYFLGSSATHGIGLFQYREQKINPIVRPNDLGLTSDDISNPQALEFLTHDKEIAHGFYYTPKSSQISAPKNTLPPLIVMCHGGPTGATETSLNVKIQFWTSRGFAVLDVNYRGSTGYGRAYRDRLKKNWGITDVIDACSGVHYLIGRGLVNKEKIAIRGSSAGGYTVLAALTFSDTFKAGASLYGIGDLEALAKDTHKFEVHYLDSLVGEYPKEKAVYHARSPIHHIDKLNCPVIFLQGLKDKVVPPAQAEAMVAALRAKGIKTTYVTFAEEGHGFRQAESIKTAIDSELAFYLEVFH